MQQLKGSVERITYQNMENGFTVAQIVPQGLRKTVTVVGVMPALQEGEEVLCIGQYTRHITHGMQFEASTYETKLPADVKGMERYLASGLVKGIGKKMAERIVKRFGSTTFDVIETSVERLSEVEGIGPMRAEAIAGAWEEQKAIRGLLIFLQNYGLPTYYAHRIFRRWGKESIKMLQENPYRVSLDVPGFGFKTADKIALKVGVDPKGVFRVEAAIEYLLKEAASQGHTCLPQHLLKESVEKFIEPPLPFQEALDSLEKSQRVIISALPVEGESTIFVWTTPFYRMEQTIAERIAYLSKGSCRLRAVDLEKALAWVEKKRSIKLAEQQREAVKAALTHPVVIITGGPGTGKSTITGAILDITAHLTEDIRLAAPTGKAAKRMAEICGRKAQTIHTLLEINPKNGRFKHGIDNPLQVDLLVVDEVSMVDTYIASSVLKAISKGTRLILIGDVDQLPSVGAGNFLADLIASKTVPVISLTEIFRQKEGSLIIQNAHRINQGLFPQLDPSAEDFRFIVEENPEKLLEKLCFLFSHEIPRKYSFSPLKDIQILAPMKRGIVGIDHINQKIQQMFHPEESTRVYCFGQSFAVGDKVMQTKNNYDKEVFNGDIGFVSWIDSAERRMGVLFEEREVEYRFQETEELSLAYAITVHKYQGSEAPCILLPLHTSHFMVLKKRVLYTALTRGKKMVIILGTGKAVHMALRDSNKAERFTGLYTSLLEKQLRL